MQQCGSCDKGAGLLPAEAAKFSKQHTVSLGDARGPCSLLRQDRAFTDISSPRTNSPGSDLITLVVFKLFFFCSGHFYSGGKNLNICTLMYTHAVTLPGEQKSI